MTVCVLCAVLCLCCVCGARTIRAEILKRVLTELAVVYKDFSDIVKQQQQAMMMMAHSHGGGGKKDATMMTTMISLKNLVPQPTLTYEIKKYSRSFD